MVAVSACWAGPAQAQSPDDVVGTVEETVFQGWGPSLDADAPNEPGPSRSIYVTNPVEEPDPPIDGVDTPTAAELAAPSVEIADLRQQSINQSAAAAPPEVCVGDHDGRVNECVLSAASGYRCAVNSFTPVRIGRSPYQVQGRAINVCHGDIVSQDVTTCVTFFGRDRIWHGAECGNKRKNGSGTIDHRPAGPCVSGLRFWRTEAFGHVVTSNASFTSRVDKSKQTPIRC
jgi:hypothetical protein